MPDYIASLNIDGDVKDITIKNNTFKDAPICGDYLLTSINSGNTLARATLNWNTTSYNISTTNCTYGETATVTVKINESATGNITVKVDGQVIPMPIDNGVVIITIFNLSGGVHNLNISYSGDDNYLPFETTEFTVTVSKTTPDVIVSVENVTYGEDAIVNVSVVGVDSMAAPSGSVTFYLGVDEITVDLDDKGTASYPFTDLSIGNYSGNVQYNGDNNYFSSVDQFNFTVDKATPEVIVSVENVTYGEDAVVNVSVVGVGGKAIPSGNVTIFVNGSEVANRTLVDGKCSYNISGLDVGNYILFVKYNGDSNYNPTFSENPFDIRQLETVVTVDPVKGKAGEKVTITARVTDENGNPVNEGKVIIGFNGKEYTANVVDGIATVEVVLPSAGTYSATAYYEGFNYNSSSSTFTVEVSDIPGPNPNPNPNPVNNGVGNMENTGNPLLVLLIALCAIGLESFRRKF